MKTTPTAQSLVDRFKLLEHGQSRGLDGLPLPTQSTLDNVEKDVANYCNNLYAEQRKAYLSHRSTLQQRFENLKDSSLDPETTFLAENVCKDIETTVKKHRPELQGLHKEAQQAISDFNRFKNDEKLTAAPDYPESRLWYWGILFALILIETILNGFFFGIHLSGGTLAGITNAILVAVINVVVLGGLISGMVRQFHHRDPRRKVVGMAVLIATVVMAVFWNLLVAHYREALPLDYPEYTDSAPENCFRGDNERAAEQEALCLFLANPFKLTGFQSWTLLLLGLAMCARAAIDWLKTDDFYPGYGKRDRKRREMEERLQDDRSELLAKIKQLYSEGEHKLQAGFRDPMEIRRLALEDYNKLHNLHTDLRDFAHNLEKNCKDALDMYRTQNREAPRPTPEPQIWQKSWKASWDLPEPPDKTIIMSEGEAKKLKDQMHEILEQQEQKLQKCRDEWQELVIQFTKLNPYKGIPT